MVGIGSEAKITINVDVKGESLEALRKAMSSLGKALDASNTAKQLEMVEGELNDSREAVKKLTGEIENLQAQNKEAMSAMTKAQNALAAAEKKMANQAKTSAAQRANAYKQGVIAAKKEIAEDNKLQQEKKQTAQAIESQAATQMSAMQKVMGFTLRRISLIQKSEQAYNEAVAAELAGYLKTEKKAADAVASEKEKQDALNRTKLIYLALVGQMQEAEAAENELRRQAVALIGAQKILNEESEEREKQLAAEAARTKALSEAKERMVARDRLVASMEKQQGDFLKRNEKLYISLRNATDLTADELERYARAVRDALTAQSRHQSMLSGKGVDVAGKRVGFLTNLRYNLSHYEQQMDAIFRASFRLQMVGNNLNMFARDILRWGTQIMSVFGEFEYNANRAAGALSIWQDSFIDGMPGIDLLQSSILDTSQALMLFPAKEVAESLYFWGSATGQVVDSQEDLNVALSGMIPIMQTAAMTGSDYEATIKGVYSVITQFYNGALDKAADVTKTLFYITQKTAAEFPDLINSFKMVGPIAAEMGVAFEEVAYIFGKLADLGVRSTMSGRGFRQIFIQLVKPSGPALEAINDLWSQREAAFGGKSFVDTIFPEGEFIGFENYMKKLAIATEEQTEHERQAFLARISTANSLPILSALVADYTREMHGLNEETEKLLVTEKNVNMYFSRSWELLSGSWNAVAGSVQRSIERIAIVAGGQISESLKPLVDLFNQLAEQFRMFIERNPELVQALAKVAAGLAAIAAVAGAVFTVVGALAGLGAAIYLATMSFGRWIPAITGVVASLGILADSIIRNWEYIQARLQIAVDGIAEAFAEWGDQGSEAGDVITAALARLQPVFDNIVIGVTNIVGSVLDLVAAIIRLDDSLGGLLSGTLGAFVGIFVGAKLIGGILGIGIALAKMVATPIIRGMAALWVGLNNVKIAATGASRAMALMGIAGGPIGWASLAASFLLLSDFRIPILSDAVDMLTGNFKDLNAELRDTLDIFDVFAPKVETAIKESASALTSQMGASELKRIIDPSWSLADTISSSLRPYESEAAFDEAVAGMLGGEALESLRSEATDILIKQLSSSLVDDANAVAIGLEQASRNVIGQQEYIGLLQKLLSVKDMSLDTVPARTLDMFSGDLAKILLEIPDYLSHEEAKEIFNKMGEKYAATMSGVDFGEFWVALSIGDRIVEGFDSKTQVEIPAAIDKIGRMLEATSLTQLQEMMKQPILGDRIISTLKDDPRIPEQLRQAIDSVYRRYDTLWAEAIDAEEILGMEAATKRLNDAFAAMTDNMFQAVFSKVPEFIAGLENATMFYDEPAKMAEQIAAVFTTPLEDGTLLTDYLEDSKMDEGVTKAFLQYLEWALENGLNDPALKSLYTKLAAEAGESAEGGTRKIKESFSRGVLEGLQSERLTMKQLREAFDAGRTSKQLRKLVKENWSRAMDAAFNWKRSNLDSRMLGRDRLNVIRDTLIAQVNRLAGTERGKQQSRKWLAMFNKHWEDMPRAAQLAMNNVVKLIEDIYGKDFVKRIFPDYYKIEKQAAKERDKAIKKHALPVKKPRIYAKGKGAPGTVADFLQAYIPPVATAVDEAIGTALDKPAAAVTATVEFVGNLVNNQKVLAATAETGAGIGGMIVDGVKFELDNSLVTDSIVGFISASATAAMYPVQQAGRGLGQAFIDGFGQVSSITPPEGASNGLRNSTISIGSKSYPMTQPKTKKEVKVTIEVTSPDGSVNKANRQDILRAAREAFSISGIEHFAAMGP